MRREEWRTIPEFDLYEVSNTGKVRSKERIISRGSHFVKLHGKILKGSDNGVGYLRVFLKQEGRVKQCYIHRLVAECFLDNPESKPCVNHLDNNPLNNNVENLEWCTKQENTDWMIMQGRNKRTENWLSNLHKSQEKTYMPVVGRNVETGEEILFPSLNSVKEFGFQPSCVCCCCKGKRIQHKGYVWEYI